MEFLRRLLKFSWPFIFFLQGFGKECRESFTQGLLPYFSKLIPSPSSGSLCSRQHILWLFFRTIHSWPPGETARSLQPVEFPLRARHHHTHVDRWELQAPARALSRLWSGPRKTCTKMMGLCPSQCSVICPRSIISLPQIHACLFRSILSLQMNQLLIRYIR